MNTLKILTLATIISLASANGQAKEISNIHSNCLDYTFNYNSMTVHESKDHIHFTLKGVTVMKLNNSYENAISNFKIKKSNCSFSDDMLLINCSVPEINITRSTPNGSIDYYNQSQQTLKNLKLDIRFVESAHPYLFNTGFELMTSYSAKDTNQLIQNRVTFAGSRNQGCKSPIIK